MSTRRNQRLAAEAVVVLALVAGFLGGGATPAQAAGGSSTPGLVVTAQNPGGADRPSDLRITLTAHSDASSVVDPSCRPKDANLECWGSLLLRMPSFGGMTLQGIEVHRVSLGGSGGHDGGGGCEGDDGDGCGDDHEGGMTATASTDQPVTAVVNGLASVVAPGDSGLAAGTSVQVKMSLVDNGTAQYADTIAITINRSVGKDAWQLVYATGPQTIQQVRIHEDVD